MDGVLDWFCHADDAPPHLFAALRPDFLVVAPPKTGSTWLADNLRCHPDLFVPDVKELKYFSWLGRWLGPSWYLSQFAPGAGRIRGEVSPSYGYLPLERIHLVRTLFPNVRIVYLLREPVGRAWSHTRHTCRHAEAHFTASPASRVDAPDIDWQAAAAHEWVTASGDYLGQLRRWLAVFPRSSVLIRFYEEIASDPETLLRDVLAFLGADPTVPLDAFPLRERINPGMEHPMPPEIGTMLHRLWHDRTRELVDYLSATCGLVPPTEWQAVLAPPADGPIASPVFAPDFEHRLAEVVSLEETFPESERIVCPDWDGFRITLRQRRLFAEGHGIVLEAPALPELKRLVAARRASLDRARIADLEARAAAAIAAAATERQQLAQRIAALELAVRPLYRRVGRWVLDRMGKRSGGKRT